MLLRCLTHCYQNSYIMIKNPYKFNGHKIYNELFLLQNISVIRSGTLTNLLQAFDCMISIFFKAT